MARRQHHNSISLFPFLAVLVCAMGSLILLLLVMTRKIRQDQNAELDRMSVAAATSIPAALPDRSAEIANLDAQILLLRKSLTDQESARDALNTSIRERQQLLKSLQDELNSLQVRLSESGKIDTSSAVESAREDASLLTAKEVALLRQLDGVEKALLEKHEQLARVEVESRAVALVLQDKNSALISLRDQVRKAQEDLQTSSGTSTLLEFTNPTGTVRTPIVIDVTATGFEILPNGIRISTLDMEGFPVRDNPLLSAILAAHRHRAGISLIDEPYVLLLVRPDGCLPFYGAQRVLTESHIHYGYELLEPDREVVAGQLDPTELPIIQTAMEDAFRRRENLYSKLLAIARQDGRPSGGTGSEATTRERRLSIRPDGRVVANEPNDRRPLDGRFYAGGVAPPASLLRNRPIGGYQTLDPDHLTADEAEKLADEFAARYAQQQVAARAEQAANEPRENSDQSSSAQSDGPRRSAAEQRFSDQLFGGDGSLQASRVVNRNGDGNRTEDPGAPSGDSLSPVADDSSSAPLLSLKELSDAAKPSSGPISSKTPEEAWLSPAAPAGNTQNASTTDGASAPSDAVASGEPPLLSGDPSGEISTGRPDLSRIDRDLISRLQTGKRSSGSLSTPVGITVFLDENHMTVGQQTAVELTHDTMNQALATLLTGINAEVEDVRRDPMEPMMPIVKFIISPGGEKWRIPLSRSLRDIGIHSATVFELTPYMISHDSTGYASLRNSD